MRRSLFALWLMLFPMMFAYAEDSFLTGFPADQIANYQDMPHSIVVRIRKGREDIAEIACFQKKVAKGESLAGASFMQVGQWVENMHCPNFLTAAAIAYGSTARVNFKQDITFSWNRRYLPRNATFHTLHPYDVAGYVRFQFAGHSYDYAYYDTEETLTEYRIYYSWY